MDIKDRIVFPLDVSTTEEARVWIKRLSDKVGMFKVGLELFIKSGHSIVHYANSYGNKVFWTSNYTIYQQQLRDQCV